MSACYKFMCGCEYCITAKTMHSSLLTWHGCPLKQIKDLSHNVQNIRSGEIKSRIFEAYKNSIRSHGCHICTNIHPYLWKQFFPVPLHITGYHTGNVCYAVVINA